MSNERFALTEKETDAALPCPFCSAESVDGFTDGRGWWLQCRDCQCDGPYAPSRRAVVFAWNRRPGRSTEERLQEMEEMHK